MFSRVASASKNRLSFVTLPFFFTPWNKNLQPVSLRFPSISCHVFESIIFDFLARALMGNPFFPHSWCLFFFTGFAGLQIFWFVRRNFLPLLPSLCFFRGWVKNAFLSGSYYIVSPWGFEVYFYFFTGVTSFSQK